MQRVEAQADAHTAAAEAAGRALVGGEIEESPHHE